MKQLILGVSLIFASHAALAGIAVIVHPSNAAAIDQSEIAKIYLGKTKSFSSGEQAVPLNLSESLPEREQFDSKALEKSSSQLKAYWSKLVFTGKGTPPKDIASMDEVVQLVSTNPNTIGYVDSSKVTSAVKVVAEF